MKRKRPSTDRNPGEAPLELHAPLEWSHAELEQLRLRVRALMAEGKPRSVASQAAFGELVARRALERARAEAVGTVVSTPPEPPSAA